MTRLTSKFLSRSPSFTVALLALAGGSSVLPIRVNAVILILALIGVITVSVNKAKIKNSTEPKLYLTLVTLLFIVKAAGLFYSADYIIGLMDLERFGYALLATLAFFLVDKRAPTLRPIIISLFAVCLLIILYGLNKLDFALVNGTSPTLSNLGHTYFTDLISIHPTYLSIYLIFIFFFLTEELRTGFRSMRGWEMGLYVFGVLLVVAMLLFVRSQMELLVFAVSCVIYLIILQKRRAWFTAFLLCVAALMVFLLDKDRVQTVFDRYGKNVSTALDNRFQVWAGAWEAIKSAPILGAGTGGQQLALKEGYKKVGYQEGIDKSYNAHNQYLESWVRNGIVELALLLALLIYSFRQSLKSPNHVFLMFLIVFSLSMLTESCLSVHRGVVFFYFFLSAFIYLPYDKKHAESKADAP